METFVCTSGDRLGKGNLQSHRGNSKMYAHRRRFRGRKVSHRKNPMNVQRKLKTSKMHHDEDIQEGLLKD